MKSYVLLFHFEDQALLNTARKALLPLPVVCKDVPQEEWDTPIGVLADLEVEAAEDAPEAMDPTEEVIVLCGPDGELMRHILTALRRAEVNVPIKAMVTPTNKNWTIRQLFGELYAEHQMVMQMRQSMEQNEA